MTKLSASTRLTDVLAFSLSWTGNSFSIGNLWGARTDVNFELADEPIENDLEV